MNAMIERTWTTDEVSEAMQAAAQLIAEDDGIGAGEADIDLINLVVNAGLMLLGNPGTTLNQVMDANYDGGAATVRTWWDWH